MRIQELTLKNFRGFKAFSVPFEYQITVIAGINGQGKTAILEALALLISRLLPQISPAKLGYRNFEISDIHGGEDAASLEMRTICGGIPIRYRGGFERLIPIQSFPKLPPAVQREIRNAYGNDNTRSNDAAPIAVYYTTDRAGFSKPRNLSGRILRGQAAAYHRALVKKQVNYKDFMQRYRALASQAATENPHFLGRRAVEVIERALRIFLEGFSDLRVEESPPRLLVNKGRTTLDLAQLSDGQRSVLAMVSDLCKRLCQANPQIDPLSGEGVVLIDELELHLHPTWQREIIDKFRRTFPRIQFITTTHSPFVIQSLRPGELVNLEPTEFAFAQDLWAEGEDTLLPPPAEYSNQSVEDIAEDVMGVKMPQKSVRYQQMMEAAEEYFRLLRESERLTGQELEVAKRKLDELAAPFSDDPAYQALLKVERETTLGGDQNASG